MAAKKAKKVKKAKTAKKKAAPKKTSSAAKKARPVVKKKVVKKKARPAKRVQPGRPVSSWFDEESHRPLIEEQVQRLETFLAAVADGTVDEGELKAQEARLVQAMQKVEPMLDANTHDKVTKLLSELTAYDIMQSMYAMQQARARTEFQG